MWALFNDLAQRVVTWNKREQRATVRRVLGRLGAGAGARVLDYGCGTGLFATTLAEQGARYVGYDIDARCIQYASRLYRTCVFTDDRAAVLVRGPYACVLANCCFHHIADAEVGDAFDFIKQSLGPDGHFVLVDILAPPGRRATFRQIYGLLEQGEFIRRHEDYLRMLGERFEIVSIELSRAHVLSTRLSPFYTDLGIYVCRAR